jgi:hypothetical protein
MEQIDLIPKIKELCSLSDYDAAIALCRKIEDHEISIKCELLCIESERIFLSKKSA